MGWLLYDIGETLASFTIANELADETENVEFIVFTWSVVIPRPAELVFIDSFLFIVD